MLAWKRATMVGLATGLFAFAGGAARAGITAGVDFNVDASLDTDGDDRWEDVDSAGTSGFDFELDADISRLTTGVSSLPGITAAYDFPGGATGNNDGALLSEAGTGDRRSFKSSPAVWNTGDVSIEMWFKPDDLTPSPSNGQILFEDGGGRGLGLFVDDNLVRWRSEPDAVQVNYDISAISGEFIQTVGTFDVSTGGVELYVNGSSVGTVDTDENDWTGGDSAAVGTRGGGNTGGIGGGQQDTESFDGQIAIFRLYREILTSQQVEDNYWAVAAGAGGLFFDNAGGSGDGDWGTEANWDPEAEPTDVVDAYVGSAPATVTQAGEAAQNLTLGHNEATAPGDGTLTVSSGDLTVGDLALGQNGTQGTLELNGGTVTVTGDTTTPGTGVLDLNGGELVLAEEGTTHQVTTYNHDDGATLRLGISGDPAVITSLDVTGTATFGGSGTPTVDVDITGDAAPGTTATWNAGAGNWTTDANWDIGVMPGEAGQPIAVGEKFTFLTAGTLNAGNVTGAGDWQANVVGTDLELERVNTPTGAGAVKAVINTASADVTSNAPLRIAPEGDADATELQVDDGALAIAGTNELVLGGGVTGEVTQNGGAVDVTGNLRFGPNGDDFGGTYQFNGGTLNVDGDIVETNEAVDAAQLHIDGGTLSVAGDILVQRFAVGNETGTTGAYAITGGQNVESTGHTAVGADGTGVLDLTGGTLTSDSARVGENGGGDGTVTVDGGTWLVTDGDLIVGEAGTGRVDLDSGMVSTQDTTLGNSGSGDGTVEITGGTWSASSTVTVGNGGTGTLQLVEGELDVDGSGGFVVAGSGSGTGEFVMGTPDGSTNPTLTVNGANWETAHSGTGTTTLLSGTATLESNNFITGQGAGSDSTVQVGGGSGTFTLNIDGGSGDRDWNTNSGHGDVTVLANGTINVGRNIQMGSGGAGSGLELTIDGGTVNVGTQQAVGGGMIDYRDGGTTDAITLESGVLNLNGGDILLDSDGDLTINGGRLEHVGRLSGAVANIPDSSGNNYDGNPQTVASAAGKLGTAVAFGGDDSVVSFGDIDEMDSPGAFTVSMWFNRETDRDDATNHDVDNVLIAQSDGDNNDNLELGTDGDVFEIYIDSGDNNVTPGLDATVTHTVAGGIANETWHHVALTYDQNRTDELELWFNGSSLASWDQFDGTLDGTTASPLSLGMARPDNDAWGDLDGMIDDFGLWTRALDSTEIAQLWNGGDGGSVSVVDSTDLLIHTDMEVSGSAFAQDGGVIAPGGSVGTTEILGDYDLNGGTFEVEIDGAGSNDFLDISGDATLTGVIDASSIGGYEIQIGETFDVLTAGTVSVGSLTATGFDWNVISGGNGEILQLTSAIPEPSGFALLLLAALATAAAPTRRHPRRS